MHVGQVDIGKGDAPLSVRLPAGCTCSVTAPIRSLRGDDRRVVGAGDGDVDLFGRRCRRAGRRADGEALDLGLARREILHGAVRDRVGPGRCCRRCRCRWCRRLDRRERPSVVPIGAGRRHQVHVGQVDIGKADEPLSGEVAGRRICSVTAPVTVRRRDDRRVVGAGDGDVDCFVTMPPGRRRA